MLTREALYWMAVAIFIIVTTLIVVLVSVVMQTSQTSHKLVHADVDADGLTTTGVDIDSEHHISIRNAWEYTKTTEEDNVHSKSCVNDSQVVDDNDSHCVALSQRQSISTEHKGVSLGEPNKAENGFDSFIRDYVIPTFCFQRRDKQFAVLFLSKYDENNIHKTQFDPHCKVCPRALVDPRQSHYPGYVCRHLGNYIAARPDRNKKKVKHAEQILLDKQLILIANYTRHHGRPRLIVLYSWLWPCSNCTTRIIRVFKNQTKVILAYTSLYQTKTIMKQDRRRLEQANITVIRVKYNHQLPPTQ